MKYAIIFLLFLNGTGINAQVSVNHQILAGIDSAYSQQNYKEVLKLGSGILLINDISYQDTSFSKSLVLCGKAAFNLRNYEDARIYYKKAVDYLKNQQNISPSYLVEAYTGIGLSYKRENVLDSSAFYAEHAISTGLDQLAEDDVVFQNSYNNLGNTYRILGQFDKALSHHKKALAIKLSNYETTDYRIGDTYNNMALVMHDMYEFGKAKVYYNEALTYYIGKETHLKYRQALVQYNMARIHYDLKDHEQCEVYVNRAVGLMDSLGMNGRAIYYEMLTLLTNALSETGRFEEAEKVLMTTLAKKSKILKANDLYWNYTYTAASILKKAQGKYDEANGYLNKSLDIAKIHYDKSHPELINIYFGLADIALLQNDLAEAFTIIQEVESSLAARTAEMKIISNEQELLLWQKKAVSYDLLFEKTLDENDLDKGLQAIDQAIMMLNKTMQSGFEQKTRIFIAENHQYLLKNALNLYQKKWDKDEAYIEKALQLIDENRNFQLGEAVKQIAGENTSSIPREIIDKGIRIRKGMIDIKESLASQKENNVSIADYEQQLNQWTEFNEALKLEYPEYYQKFYQAPSFNLKKLQLESEKKSLAFIQFYETDEELFRFVIDGKKLYVNTISVTKKELASKISSVRDGLYDIEGGERLKEELKWIYENTLGDFLTELNKERLVIIPDGELQLIPFEILFDGESYLIESYPISYAYALHLWQSQNESKMLTRKPYFGGFAPNYKTQDDEAGEIEGQHIAMLLRSEGERLPGALDAVSNMHGIIGGDVFIGESATESKFKEVAGKFGVIHCAVHGIFDADKYLNSGLLFQPTNDDEDGLLTVSEISRLDLHANLAVLSACNSGWGKLHKTEGMQSIGYGFAYAGVPSNIMSMWKVPDHSTAEVMKSFYKHLKSGEPKDMALRNAKLEYMKASVDKKQQHPLFWAGFILNGNLEAITFSSSHIWWYIISLLSVLGILLLKFLNNKKENG